MNRVTGFQGRTKLSIFLAVVMKIEFLFNTVWQPRLRKSAPEKLKVQRFADAAFLSHTYATIRSTEHISP